MAEYRAFTVGRDGHIVGFEALICVDDAEAIERAKRLVGKHTIEIGARFVIRLEPEPE